MTITGYMCRIDFEVEQFQPHDGNRIFGTVADLRSAHKCADECGIVEVEISLKRVIVEGTV